MSDEELDRILDLIDDIKGISILGIIPKGDIGAKIERDFHAYMDTAEGRFAAYRAANSR